MTTVKTTAHLPELVECSVNLKITETKLMQTKEGVIKERKRAESCFEDLNIAKAKQEETQKALSEEKKRAKALLEDLKNIKAIQEEMQANLKAMQEIHTEEQDRTASAQAKLEETEERLTAEKHRAEYWKEKYQVSFVAFLEIASNDALHVDDLDEVLAKCKREYEARKQAEEASEGREAEGAEGAPG